MMHCNGTGPWKVVLCLLMFIGLLGGTIDAQADDSSAKAVVRWINSTGVQEIDNQPIDIDQIDPMQIPRIRWVQHKDATVYLLGAGKRGEHDMLTVDKPFSLQDNQAYRVTVNHYRQVGDKGWKTLFIALVDDAGHQYGVSLGKSDEGFVFSRDPQWQSLGGQFALRTPLTLTLQRRAGKLEILVGDKLIYANLEPVDRRFDRLILRVSRQYPQESVLAELAPILITPAQVPGATPADKPVTGKASGVWDDDLGHWFVQPTRSVQAPPLPLPSAFPRVVVMHNMWWSTPSSGRFIAGSHPNDPNYPAGSYENAPLIPPANADAWDQTFDDLDQAMAVQVFKDAHAAGIDCLIYDSFSERPSEFAHFFQMAEAARRSGTGVQVLPCLDRIENEGVNFLQRFWLYHDPDTKQLLREHPNIMRVGQCPVIFEYRRVASDVWQQRLERAQAVGGRFFLVARAGSGSATAVMGQMPDTEKNEITYASAAYLFTSHSTAFNHPDPVGPLIEMAKSFDPPKAVGGAVTPGYIGTTRVGNLLDPRGTWMYRKQWTDKIKLNPDFVHLTTGNDYSEATEQECTFNSTFTFMDLTRYFGTRWRTGLWPKLDKPQAFLSYRAAVSIREKTEVELVLLRPEITGEEPTDQIARRFIAACYLVTDDGQRIELSPALAHAESGQIVWRFWNDQPYTHAGWARPEVVIRVDGQTVALPQGPTAAFCIMDQGEELARKWLRVPLHRIRPGVMASVNVTGSPANLYPRTLTIEGLPQDQVAGALFMRNGITSIWTTLPASVLRNGLVECFIDTPGYMPVKYQDAWRKRRLVDQTDRYTAVVRMDDGSVVYPQPVQLPAPHVASSTVMDWMIPVALDQLGPTLSEWQKQQWQPLTQLLKDRGPLGHDLKLPPVGDPTRPDILRDSSKSWWFMRFDGKANQLRTGALTMPPGPVTVEMLIRFRQTDRGQVIWDQWGHAMGIGLTGQGTVVLARQNQHRNIDWLQGKQQLTPERWYRLTGTYDGSELRLYVDGEPDGQAVASHGLRTDEKTVIGGGTGMWARMPGLHERVEGYFQGDIARIRVLQNALSESQIKHQ